TLAATGLLLKRGPSCGHDFDFHFVSWLEVARAWHSGLFYPHWASSPNFGAGEPRFIFYPPASWILGAVLGSIAGWHATPWLFTAICFFCAGLGMRRLARTWLTPHAATAAGCLYIANPYMLFVAYERTAYGELMAAALVPLLLCFAVSSRPPIAALAAAVSGIWLMNAPSGVMACYALLWIALLRLVSDRNWRVALRLAASTTMGLVLAAFYLVPAAYQERWVEIARAIGPDMRFQDSFLFHHTGEPFHDAVLHTASILACILLALALASIALWRNALRSRPLLLLASLVPLILLLLLPISAPLWRHTPQLAYIQFPWRWLLVLAPVATLFLAGSIAQRARTTWLVVIVAVVCLASILVCTRAFHQYCDEEDSVSAQVALMQAGDGEEGTDEYTARNDDNAEVDQDMPQVRVLIDPGAEEPDSGKVQNPEYQPDPSAERHATITVPNWSLEHRLVSLNTPAAGYAVFRLMDYPAWTIHRNGVEITQRPRRDDGLLTIPIPQGRSQIDIRWRTTPDIRIGRALSLLGFCVLAFAWWLERRTRSIPTP
ncbi:MAG: 6-pyruvoyl-tetrahydropterin synthase-related protein, partial [Acidobacteriaceae bacterium]